MNALRIGTLALALASLGALNAQAQTIKIGIFDPMRILSHSKAGQALEEDVNRFRIEREAELKKKKSELERLVEQFKAGMDTMSTERQEELQQDLGERNRALQRLAADAEQDLKRKLEKHRRGLERQVAEVLEGYGKSNGYTLILQRDLCAFASSAIDISDEIIRLIDSNS